MTTGAELLGSNEYFLPETQKGSMADFAKFMDNWVEMYSEWELARNRAYFFGETLYRQLKTEDTITPGQFAMATNDILGRLSAGNVLTDEKAMSRGITLKDEHFYDRWRDFAAKHIAREAFGEEFYLKTIEAFEVQEANTVDFTPITE